ATISFLPISRKNVRLIGLGRVGRGQEARDARAISWKAGFGKRTAESGCRPTRKGRRWRSFATEGIELTASRCTEEGMPFRWREPENLAVSVLAVPDADLAIWQSRYLDAAAVAEAQGALDPVRAGIWRSRAVTRRGSFHGSFLAARRPV